VFNGLADPACAYFRRSDQAKPSSAADFLVSIRLLLRLDMRRDKLEG